MISEPEMVGDSAAWPEPETATGETRPPRRPGPRPWWWALGGAVAASVVWAGVLYAYGPAAGAVDLRGYRVAEDLCAKVELRALSTELGKRSEAPGEMLDEHSALDKITCGFHFVPRGKPAEEGVSVQYGVELVLETHKKTDPEPEFEALVEQPSWLDGLPPRPEEVPALGEKAFLTGTGEGEDPRLRVLDGGAVFSLTVSAEVSYDEDYFENASGDVAEPDTDLSAMPPLMVEDMRELMAVFKGEV
ncbi:hypothetical protein GCM10009730_18900 [Streptomyces albidochromogenes]|uniref:hypothetical protein n=1 Tax=Streptomyces albidochromogenes TaxID=329524 RepID=UPI00110F8132|nr:hypothetical protein [Streptomyces albidochromogenes]